MSRGDVICAACGAAGQRPRCHLNRAARLGYSVYCSRACAHDGRAKTPLEKVTPELAAQRAYMRERAKMYRHGSAREQVLAAQRKTYRRNRAANLERMKEYRAANKERCVARVKEWLQRNPDKKELYDAKYSIIQATGLKFREIPDELAKAKVEELRLKRWLRDPASVDTHPKGGNSPESEVPFMSGAVLSDSEGDAQPTDPIDLSDPSHEH